jgi:hypothetical protein
MGDEEVEPTTHPKILRCNSTPVIRPGSRRSSPARRLSKRARLTSSTASVMARAPQRVSAEAAAPEPA